MIIKIISLILMVAIGVPIAWLIYLMSAKVCELLETLSNNSNHYLKQEIKAQDRVIAALCNALNR